MKNSTLFIIIGISVFIIFGVGLFFTKMNVYSNLNVLRQEYNGQMEMLKVGHDNMFKTLKQIAQVDTSATNSYRNYVKAWENAMSRGATLDDAVKSTFPMFFVQAGMSQQDLSIKQKLVDAIAIKRDGFQQANAIAVAACVELNKFVGNPWNQLFLKAEDEIPVECTTITSTVSEDALRNEVDDNTSLY